MDVAGGTVDGAVGEASGWPHSLSGSGTKGRQHNQQPDGRRRTGPRCIC